MMLSPHYQNLSMVGAGGVKPGGALRFTERGWLGMIGREFLSAQLSWCILTAGSGVQP